MGFFAQFGLLFANMTWPVVVCLVAGITFVLIEIFQPGFGVFGSLGLILIAAGMVLRGVFRQPEDSVLAQMFIMLLIISIIILAGFCFMVFSSKKGWLSRTAFVEKETAVSKEISDGTSDYRNLLGKIGMTVTDLRPVGKIAIDGNTLDAQAESFFITKGEGVKVVETEGGKIVVRLVE